MQYGQRVHVSSEWMCESTCCGAGGRKPSSSEAAERFEFVTAVSSLLLCLSQSVLCERVELDTGDMSEGQYGQSEDGGVHDSGPLPSYRHLHVRYTALRTAYRRLEAEVEASRAAQRRSECEAAAAAEERCSEQRVQQQLSDSVTRLQSDNGALRAREEQSRVRERQSREVQRALEADLATRRSECAVLQSQVDRQCGAVAAERARLIAVQWTEVSAQQRTIQSLTQTVDEMRDEVATRETEREQLLSEMQLLKDAVQILRAPCEQSAAHRAEAAAEGPVSAMQAATVGGTASAAAASSDRLFLSPLYVASPGIDATPSTSTCAALHFSALPALQSTASTEQSVVVLGSSLAWQLLHADVTSSPAADSDRSGAEQSTVHTDTATSAFELCPISSPHSSRRVASSVPPLSPFSADDFPPLPSSPSTARQLTPRSVWHKTVERTTSAQADIGGVAESRSNGTGNAINTRSLTGLRIDAESLHFTASDGQSTTAASAPPLAADESTHTCFSPSCLWCQRPAPPASILLPLTFDTPNEDRTSGSYVLSESLDSPSRAAVRRVLSSTPCSSCQLRACSTLLTPLSSSQRSLAVLDSEFRRVKRWTAQLQQHITTQQQQRQQHTNYQHTQHTLARPSCLPRHPATATLVSFHSQRSAISRRQRCNSDPHPTLLDQQQRTEASAMLSVAAASPAAPVSVSVQSLLVQLSLCESQLAAKELSVRAAAQHIDALQDKLSLLTDSIEQMEDAYNQQCQEQRSRAADELGRQRQAVSEEVQAAEERVASLAELCSSLRYQLDEARRESATQHSHHTQQRLEWEQRCSELEHSVAALEGEAERRAGQQRWLRAELDTVISALPQQRDQQADTVRVEQQCSEDDRSMEGRSTLLTDTTTECAASPPLLQLVELQLWEEMNELQLLVRCM